MRDYTNIYVSKKLGGRVFPWALEAKRGAFWWEEYLQRQNLFSSASSDSYSSTRRLVSRFYLTQNMMKHIYTNTHLPVKVPRTG